MGEFSSLFFHKCFNKGFVSIFKAKKSAAILIVFSWISSRNYNPEGILYLSGPDVVDQLGHQVGQGGWVRDLQC